MDYCGIARPLRMERAGSDKRGISSMWRRRSGKEYRLVLGSMCRRSWFWAAVSFWRRSVARWGGWHREQPQRRALKRRRSWKEVLTAVEGLCGEKWEALRDRHGHWARELALYLGRRTCGLRLAELGSALGGTDYAAVSVAIKRFERRLIRDHSLRKTVESIEQLLNVET